MNEDRLHELFRMFLDGNEFYKDSLDIEKENYYALFKSGYEIGWDEGYNEALEICNAEEYPYE